MPDFFRQESTRVFNLRVQRPARAGLPHRLLGHTLFDAGAREKAFGVTVNGQEHRLVVGTDRADLIVRYEGEDGVLRRLSEQDCAEAMAHPPERAKSPLVHAIVATLIRTHAADPAASPLIAGWAASELLGYGRGHDGDRIAVTLPHRRPFANPWDPAEVFLIGRVDAADCTAIVWLGRSRDAPRREPIAIR